MSYPVGSYLNGLSLHNISSLFLKVFIFCLHSFSYKGIPIIDSSHSQGVLLNFFDARSLTILTVNPIRLDVIILHTLLYSGSPSNLT